MSCYRCYCYAYDAYVCVYVSHSLLFFIVDRRINLVNEHWHQQLMHTPKPGQTFSSDEKFIHTKLLREMIFSFTQFFSPVQLLCSALHERMINQNIYFV